MGGELGVIGEEGDKKCGRMGWNWVRLGGDWGELEQDEKCDWGGMQHYGGRARQDMC